MYQRLLYLGVCGLALAGIIHIVIILMIPVLGSRDAARQIMSTLPELKFQTIRNDEQGFISSADPYFEMAVCRFGVGENGVIVAAEKVSHFWSASVYNERGEVIYSLNDRTAIANHLKLLIVSPVQMAAIRQIQPEELETSIVVETTANSGFVLIRSLVRDPSLENVTKAFLKSASCEAYEAI
ncbi:MAG: hypothetical protein AAF412_01090 [Pseudomonadota bacterium]